MNFIPRKRFIIVSLALIVISHFSLADPWTSAGSTGTVDDGNLNMFAVEQSYLYFANNVTGSIRVRYNVTNTSTYAPSWNRLKVTYKDPGSNSLIMVYLKAVDLATGTQKTIDSFNSNSFPNGNFIQQQGKWIGYSFDFRNEAYYIDVYLRRTVTTDPIGLFALQLITELN